MNSEFKVHEAQFYEAIGRALSAWQSVEAQLTPIYIAILGAKNIRAASMSFSSVTSLGARLNMLNAAARNSDNDDLESAVIGLTEKIRKKSQGRNKLAHFMYNAVTDEAGSTKIYLANTKYGPSNWDSDVVEIDKIVAWESEWRELLLAATDCYITVLNTGISADDS
ncbi:MAG: hypothetical protein ACOYVJ_06190 [Nitrospirota bacterium]